jgi:hypothetical protein
MAKPSEIALRYAKKMFWGAHPVNNGDVIDDAILEASRPLVDAVLAYCDKFEDNQFTLNRRRDALVEMQAEARKLKGE